MGIPLLSGRTFSETDRTHRVAIVSQRVAQSLWPGQDPLGRGFARSEKETFEVIGVVGDVSRERGQTARAHGLPSLLGRGVGI